MNVAVVAVEKDIDGRTPEDVGIPEGWILTTIGEICQINPPKPPKDYLPAEALVSFVPMAAVDAGSGSITAPLQRPYGEVRGAFTAFRNGDVIVAKITPCMENGKAAIARNLTNGFGFGSTEFHVLRAKGTVLPEYLHYFVRQESFRKTAEDHMTGSVGQWRVPTEFILKAPIMLPPLEEQRRIAGQIETLLSRVTGTRGYLTRVTRLLQIFRQSVLSAACSGRLTDDWRNSNPPLDESDEVFHLIRQTVGATRNSMRDRMTGNLASLPESWYEARFDQVTVSFDGRRVPVKASDREGREGSYAYYGASGVIDTVDEYRFDGDYLLVSEDGANLLARTKPIAFLASGKFWVNNHAHVLQSRGGIPLQYLGYLINSLDIQDYVTGTAQPKLTQAAMNRIRVPVPPLEEQREIVRRVEALFDLAGRVEAKVAEATAEVDRISQAVLSKAFRGELVQTEAELARREGREYEPASELLDRIRSGTARRAFSKRDNLRQRIRYASSRC